MTRNPQPQPSPTSLFPSSFIKGLMFVPQRLCLRSFLQREVEGGGGLMQFLLHT